MLKRVISYSVGLYSVTLFASVARIVVKSLITKTDGKEALGAYAYYALLVTLGCSLLAVGMRQAAAKFVASSDKESRYAPIVSVILSFLIAASFTLAGLGILLRSYIDWVYVLVLVSVGPFTLFEIARSTLRGQFDQKRELTIAFLGVVIQIGSVALFVIFSSDPRASVYGSTAGYVILATGIVFYFLRRYSSYWKYDTMKETALSVEFHHLLMLTAPIWIIDILDIVGHQADQIFVQGQLGYSAMAEYAAAFTFIGLLDQLLTVLSRVSLVTFASGAYSEIKQFQLASSLNMAFFICLGFFIISISFPLTPILFSDAFHITPLLVSILSVTCIFNSVEVLNSTLTIAHDFPQANRNAKLWSTALYIPGALLLVLRFGVVGAAWSNVFSWTAYTLIHAYNMHKRLPDHASYTFRQILLGIPLYLSAIWLLWLTRTPWLVVLILPGCLILGQLLHLWNLAALPTLTSRLLRQYQIR